MEVRPDKHISQLVGLKRRNKRPTEYNTTTGNNGIFKFLSSCFAS
jgi:hypothetical protein